MTSTGLVLGCGGTLGMTWTLAVLDELERREGWDARSADVIVGTSAGGELAAMLGGGARVADLLRAQTGEPDAPEWISAHLRAGPGRFPPLPRLRLGSPRLTVRGSGGAICRLSGLAPTGGGDPAWLEDLAVLCSDLSGWVPHPRTWLVATDYATGGRTAFGAPGAPEATLSEALRATWALPGWLPPVTIGERRYVDGGVLSPASADLLVPLELDRVIVVAPMASSAPGRRAGWLSRMEGIARRVMTRRLDAEVRELEAIGTEVVRLEPDEADLRAMGFNFMDGRRRAATLSAAVAPRSPARIPASRGSRTSRRRATGRAR